MAEFDIIQESAVGPNPITQLWRVIGATGPDGEEIHARVMALEGGNTDPLVVAEESVSPYASPIHTAPTAGAASGEILAANAGRKYALFVNDSDTTVYLALGADAVVHTGIRINANGGSYEMSGPFGNLYLGVVNGVSGIAGKVVCVTEGV